MAKRKLTPAQIKKRKERQDKFRKLWNELKAMSETDKQQWLEKYPITTCEGRVLSGTNQMLIILQTAMSGKVPTVVGGFRQWLKQGRAVQKGERGLSIWIPSKKKSEDETTPDELNFFMGTVFDVSQTAEVKEKAEVQTA